jgi:hypothetical protein
MLFSMRFQTAVDHQEFNFVRPELVPLFVPGIPTSAKIAGRQRSIARNTDITVGSNGGRLGNFSNPVVRLQDRLAPL